MLVAVQQGSLFGRGPRAGEVVRVPSKRHMRGAVDAARHQVPVAVLKAEEGCCVALAGAVAPAGAAAEVGEVRVAQRFDAQVVRLVGGLLHQVRECEVVQGHLVSTDACWRCSSDSSRTLGEGVLQQVSMHGQRVTMHHTDVHQHVRHCLLTLV